MYFFEFILLHQNFISLWDEWIVWLICHSVILSLGRDHHEITLICSFKWKWMHLINIVIRLSVLIHCPGKLSSSVSQIVLLQWGDGVVLHCVEIYELHLVVTAEKWCCAANEDNCFPVIMSIVKEEGFLTLLWRRPCQMWLFNSGAHFRLDQMSCNIKLIIIKVIFENRLWGCEFG